ncbi:PEP/pyruvate-binding domain-containing protein [Lachnoanaerobaculum gingivalis]|uniref:PEP/pyruvate-binding domain-containing protein n=1 Tax=Lachnoanaerobaculum gingivalis TaxID=2490855 RepID=UPI0024A6990F|nr:PEP/pyruvate-binding domain-containing protein [Lachnoanaerobaculum gingivalis]WHE87152.1 PEP/pyruvate-binding domain-containing protein [Lachnoanaerobaculum gingivalis]
MILDFIDIKKEDISLAGGKGANLGELISADINVPKGFVITSDSYKAFLKENGIEEIIRNKLREVYGDEIKLLKAADCFRELIRSGDFSAETKKLIADKYNSLGENIRVAIRSSATTEDLPDASFAGQQESYLNVVGIDDVLLQIRNCYASLWGNRAVSYRFHQDYDQTSIAIAVVVQKMVESEKAGVLFTVNPLSRNTNEMLINASYGLGESVVSGMVTPDSYIVTKTGKLIETTIGSKETKIVYGNKNTVEIAVDEEAQKKRVLDDNEISGLLDCGLKIEKHYGMPMDIEWAIKDSNIYILQARAITTLRKNTDEDTLIKNYIKSTKPTKSMRKNMAFQLEKMPFAYRVLDYDFIMAINDQKSKIFGEAGIIFDSDPQIDNDGIQTLPKGKKGINKNIFHFFKILKQIKDFDSCATICKEFMCRYEEEISMLKAKDFENISLQECREFLEYSYKLTKDLSYDRFKYALFPTMLVFDKYTKLLQRINPKYTAFDLYKNLDNKTSTVNKDIFDMAKEISKHSKLKEAILSGESYKSLYTGFNDFKTMVDRFLQKNGFKSDYNCYCLEAKTFIEDPDRLINILKPILLSASDQNKILEDFDELMKELEVVSGKKYKSIKADIQNFRYFHIVREKSQYLWESLFFYVRKCVTRSNLLLLENKDYKSGIANLFFNELIKAMHRGYLDKSDLENIKNRNEKFPLSIKVWEASKLLVFEAEGDILKGVSGSFGKAVGRACIIHSPNEFYKMQKGDILVCHLTDPEWTPLFESASAVVADTGAALSHAAIVAREYGIPAVLGVGFATTKYKDGDMLQVDGDKGTVRGL